MVKNKEEILAELNTVFRDVFDDERLIVSADTKAADIDDWDSLSHVRLALAIQKQFAVRFTTDEIISWMDVKSILISIVNHLS